MSMTQMTALEVQEQFAPKLLDAHPLVVSAFANCFGALKVANTYHPRSNRLALQSKIKVALCDLGQYPLADRKKGRILGDGMSDSFRVHISIHPDTPEVVASLDEVWVNYMVTGDIPTPKSVGSKLMHKGRVPLKKVVSDFCDGLKVGTAAQDTVVKNFVGKLNELVSSNIFLMTKRDLKDHYQTFAQAKRTTSCMSKSEDAYGMEGGHPIDCYENSPNMALGLLIRPDASFASESYTFSGRMFFLHDLAGKFVGRSTFYGNESQRGTILNHLDEADVYNTLYGGLLNVILSSNNELMVPYVDVVHRPQDDGQANRLHWLEDLTCLNTNEVDNLIDESTWKEQGKEYLFIGQPQMAGNTESFHGDASDDGLKVCRITDLDDAQRDWIQLSARNIQKYVDSRDESYDEEDVVWSGELGEYLHEDDAITTLCGRTYHENHEGEMYIICAISGHNVVIGDAVHSEYEGEWYDEDQVGFKVSYCPDKDDHYLTENEDDFKESHGYTEAKDVYGDTVWVENAVFSNFRSEYLDAESAIRTPDGSYIYAENAVDWIKENPTWEFDGSEFTEIAA
jgi:hypothetical protein